MSQMSKLRPQQVKGSKVIYLLTARAGMGTQATQPGFMLLAPMFCHCFSVYGLELGSADMATQSQTTAFLFATGSVGTIGCCK